MLLVGRPKPQVVNALCTKCETGAKQQTKRDESFVTIKSVDILQDAIEAGVAASVIEGTRKSAIALCERAVEPSNPATMSWHM